MSNPKKVGEGSYGCVHNPPLKCKDKLYNPDPTKVSKILTKKNAKGELKEFKLIQAADKKEDFHLGKPGSCFPDNTEINAKAIDQCNRFSSFEIDNYKLLLLKNGGQDLSNIEEKLEKLKMNNANRRRLENVWLDMSRLIYGSKVLIDNGLVHHDLKQQNIVYNEETGRVNFIDFGLMTTTKKMLKNANGSRYPFNEHWSFPPDILYYNYIAYKRMTALTGRKKQEYIQNEFKKYNIQFEIIKTDLIDENEDNLDFLKRTTWSYFDLCMSLNNNDDSYREFINKSFETFDNYAIGFSLFSILKKTKALIDKKLYNDLRLLFLSMMNFNVFERPTPSEVVDKYEFILKSNGLLEKYSMRFENHFLVEGTEKQEQEKKMEELPKNEKEFIEEFIVICPPGKERKPKTRNCINKCKEGYSRDTNFKCKKNKSQKNKKKIIDLVITESDSMVDLHKSPEKISFKSKTKKKRKKNKTKTNRRNKIKKTQKNKKCQKGKELNTKTNRCNKIKKTQKNKKCQKGKELNTKTNRCNKIKKTQKNKKTRRNGSHSKRQRGSGANCSRPTDNSEVDMTGEQLGLNDGLGTAIVAEEPDRVKQLLDEGAHATITIVHNNGMRVETIPAIMYVARHMKGPNTIIMNHLLSADSNLNVNGGCAVSNMETTLLSEAAEWGNIDMMRELLNLDADINDASFRPPALSYAVLNQDIDMVKFMIDERKGQINLGYTHDNEIHNIIGEALEQHENAEDETERERINEIVETLKKYAVKQVKQSIMSDDDFNTKCEKSQRTDKVECGIMMDEITNQTAVMPHPPSSDNTAVCFDRSALQKHLVNRFNNPRIIPPILTHPVTGVEISQNDISRMFPLGLFTDYKNIY
jgi:hypothetical protein